MYQYVQAKLDELELDIDAVFAGVVLLAQQPELLAGPQ